MPEGSASPPRPTPEQIASTYKGGVRAVRRLQAHGYVIVSPDDVPERDGDPDGPYGPNNADGWNACRARIFGSDDG